MIREKFRNGYVREISGYVIKVGGKYVGWNSFKAQPYLTNKEHAEVFLPTFKDYATPFGFEDRILKEHGLGWPFARVVGIK